MLYRVWVMLLMVCSCAQADQIAMRNFTTMTGIINSTSPAIDTTGANLLVAVSCTASQNPEPRVMHDSKNNTWLASRQFPSMLTAGQVFYAENATTGTNHTFTFSTTTQNYGSFVIYAFTNAPTSMTLDFQNGKGISTPTSTSSAGAVVPTVNNALVIASICSDNITGAKTLPTIDGPYSWPLGMLWVGGQHYGIASAWQVQVGRAPQDPAWTYGMTNQVAPFTVVFKGKPGTKVLTSLSGTIRKPDGTPFNGRMQVSSSRPSATNTCGTTAQNVSLTSVTVNITNGVLAPTQFYATPCLNPAVTYTVRVTDTTNVLMYQGQWCVPYTDGAIVANVDANLNKKCTK
jgi:hypothetical protein